MFCCIRQSWSDYIIPQCLCLKAWRGRFMLPYTIEELEGEHSDLLAPLWNAGILSEPALSRGPEDARQEYEEGWNDLVDDMLAALPYIVRPFPQTPVL